MKKVYYAHCQNLYGSTQEIRDMTILRYLFGNNAHSDNIINPGDPSIIEDFKLHKEKEGMDYFYNLIDNCEILAFRSLPDGSIPAGVAGEIKRAQLKGLLIVELPSGISRRELTVEQTREYLKEIGQR